MNSLRSIVAALAISAFTAPAFAVAVGDTFSYTTGVLARVISGGQDNKWNVEVYADPDASLSGALKIPYVVNNGDNSFYAVRVAEKGFLAKDALTSVELPYGLTEILTEAFYGCTKVTSVSGPEVEVIAQDAFRYDSQLKTIDFPKVETVGNWCFNRSGAVSVNMPAVKNIGGGAFYECAALETFNAGDAIESIGNIAFSNAPKLAGIRLTENLKTIGTTTFGFNTTMQEIVIPRNLESAGTDAFSGCGFSTVYILAPNFMDYAAACRLLPLNGGDAVYTIAEIRDAVAAAYPAMTVKTMDDVLRISATPAGAGFSFTATAVLDGISDIQIFENGKAITPVNGVYTSTGSKITAAFNKGINALNYDVTLQAASGISDVSAETVSDAPARYFRLDGTSVPASALTPGVYIRAQGSATSKIIIK